MRYVTCDGPSGNHPWMREISFDGTAADAIAEYGWIERDGKHYCMECAEEMAE